ncbi:MAG: Crp/Fnr family transcriptional regulator [Salinarimonadaceae bacterium]|nr:MAG: Crp/Fnr family transcriptional regulator [Salinarimonadaceae bacterium]
MARYSCPKISQIDDIQDSNLLRALRAEEREALSRALERCNFESGDVLAEAGDDVSHVYFPCGPSLVSFVVLLDCGRTVETIMVGREGAVGGIVSQGRLPAYARAVVQFGGPFLRIETTALEAAKDRSPRLRHFFTRYADCLLAQVFQSVACKAGHTIEQRAAKWLIAAMERTGENVVPLTQERLAGMLGVGRSYVSRVIRQLRRENVLDTRRGALVVRDREALKAKSCCCNEAVRRHFDTVLAGVYPH